LTYSSHLSNFVYDTLYEIPLTKFCILSNRSHAGMLSVLIGSLERKGVVMKGLQGQMKAQTLDPADPLGVDILPAAASTLFSNSESTRTPPDEAVVPPPTVRPEVRIGLAGLAIRTHCARNYPGLLSELVFGQQALPVLDVKTERTYKKLLASADALAITGIIWKESLSDGELATINAKRLFTDGRPTAYRLAVVLAGNAPSEVAKINSHIRSICLAAAHYQLIDRNAASNRRVILLPTPLLHNLMTTLAIRNSATIKDIFPLLYCSGS
jgi:hypothetical protein